MMESDRKIGVSTVTNRINGSELTEPNQRKATEKRRRRRRRKRRSLPFDVVGDVE
jgi:hypothetical protein